MTNTPDSELRKKVLGKIHLAVRTDFYNANRKNMEFLADDIEAIVQAKVVEALILELEKLANVYHGQEYLDKAREQTCIVMFDNLRMLKAQTKSGGKT